MKAKKGKAFERKVSKELSLWWTDGGRDDVFWLTSQSGGRATTRRRKDVQTKNQGGDIGLIDPIGQPFIDNFFLELKDGYKNANEKLFNLFWDNKVLIIDWWKKIIDQKERHQRGMIIYTPKGKTGKVIIIDKATLLNIALLGKKKMKFDEIVIINDSYHLSIIEYDTFFNWFKPGDISCLI